MYQCIDVSMYLYVHSVAFPGTGKRQFPGLPVGGKYRGKYLEPQIQRGKSSVARMLFWNLRYNFDITKCLLLGSQMEGDLEDRWV